MQIDLLPKQRITVLLPDGSELILDDTTAVLRLERWRQGRLEAFLNLTTPPCSAPSPSAKPAQAT